MTLTDTVSPDDLKRVPGLFRRWELPDVLALCRHYRIEDAGRHADGTPLVAVFTVGGGADESTGCGTPDSAAANLQNGGG